LCMERIKAIDFCQKEGTHAFTPIKIFKICWNFSWNSTGSLVHWGSPCVTSVTNKFPPF
jgi:hypothetical protein